MVRSLEEALPNDNRYDGEEFLAETSPQISLKTFSKHKQLYDFQQQALKNALKALWLFYGDGRDSTGAKDKQDDYKSQKNNLFQVYKNNDIAYHNYKANPYIEDYSEDFPLTEVQRGKDGISFEHFCNRMSFWMATGSGKTLVIIKMIEILWSLMKVRKDMEDREILFLVHKPELMKQFHDAVYEFNSSSQLKINLEPLSKFNKVRRERSRMLKDEVTVFYYSSDLILSKRQRTRVDFKDYDIDGKWFILLDEAHRGSAGTTKLSELNDRQGYYSILSRNGFLFNFSATFIEPNDNISCVYNFNLDKFVGAGYGKQVYLSQKDVEGFGKNDDGFNEYKKQIVILKTLILHSYICKQNRKIQKLDKNNVLSYHNPLIMSLGNSVNSRDLEKSAKKAADVELLFQELDKIATKNIKEGLFEEAQQELISEMRGKESQYSIGSDNQGLKDIIEFSLIEKISYEDVLRYVFNASTPGKIEVKRIPNNKQELVFNLPTEKPFALIKIGDISKWIAKFLKQDIQKLTSYHNESEFAKLNSKDSSINILLGSRAFYEGWDSNRPNIVLFVNIGQTDTKKFVLQSVGRGVRIEPMINKRIRLQYLYNSHAVSPDTYNALKKHAHAPESLFVFGTNATNLINIIKHIKNEAAVSERFVSLEKDDLFNFDIIPSYKGDHAKRGIAEKDDEVFREDLLIPIFKTSDKLMIEAAEDGDHKIVTYKKITHEDLELVSKLAENLDDKIIALKYCNHDNLLSPKLIAGVKKTLQSSEQTKYYNPSSSSDGVYTIRKPIMQLERIMKYFSAKVPEYSEFVPLKDQIKHYGRISFSGDTSLIDEIRSKLNIVKDTSHHKEELDKAFESGDRKAYDKKQKQILEAGKISIKGTKIDIEYLKEHYYNPLISSDNKDQDYFQHIIQVESEVKFLAQLAETGKKFLDENYDWWRFTKIDESVDEVYLPYVREDGSVSKFYPDFVFWMKKGREYSIFFVDPKGTKQSSYQPKADWHKKLFGEPGKELNLNKDPHSKPEHDIRVYLRFFNADSPSGEYQSYWVDNMKAFTQIPLKTKNN